MTYMAAGASNKNIRNIMSIQYLITPTDVVATVNRHQLVGRYPSYEAAELAIDGILVKCGVKQLDQALIRIPTTLVVTDGDTDSTINFPNFTTTVQGPEPRSFSCSGSQFQFTDITRPIKILFDSLDGRLQHFVKKSTTTIPTNSLVHPLNDGYLQVTTKDNLVVLPNDFVRFKALWIGSITNTNTTLATTFLSLSNKAFSKAITITATETAPL